MKHKIFLLAILLITGCSSKVFKKLPEGPIDHHLIVVAKVNDGIKAKGFSSSTPKNTSIMCTVGEKSGSAVSNADGSFELTINDLEAKFVDLIFNVDNKDYVVGYEVKDLSERLGQIAHSPFSIGKEIDFLSFIDKKALILSSNAASISIVDISDQWILSDKIKSSVLLNPDGKTNIGARMVEALGDKALVSFSLTHEISLIDTKNNEVLSKTRLKDASGALFTFKNPVTLTVKDAIDADGSGPKTSISTSFAHSPEAIFAIDDQYFLATFSNYYQFLDNDNDSVVGPGIVALMSIKGGELITHQIELLTYKNPMYFFADDQDIWITCAGAWHKQSSGIYQSHDAGITKIKLSADKNSFTVGHNISLGDFSPAEPVVVKNKIIIPHSQFNDIAVIDSNASNITANDMIEAKFPRSFNFSFASLWHDDVVILGDNLGSLVAYSLSEGFFPFPFIEPITIDPKLLPPRLHKLYFRNRVLKTPIKDMPAGFSAWAVSYNQAKIFPLDFLMVFGP